MPTRSERCACGGIITIRLATTDPRFLEIDGSRVLEAMIRHRRMVLHQNWLLDLEANRGGFPARRHLEAVS